jgi:hypothetical protein
MSPCLDEVMNGSGAVGVVGYTERNVDMCINVILFVLIREV